MNKILQTLSDPGKVFSYSLLLFTLVFLFTRLQYFLFYPLLVLSSDSASYCAVAIDLLNSDTPLFDIRTPAYPFFLSSVWLISKSFYAVALAQSLFTLLTGYLFLYIISKTYKRYTFLFALMLCIYLSSSYFLVLEKAILTESIFVNFLLINSGLLIYALKNNKTSIWILYSASIAVLILIRPAALFLFGILLLLVVYFFINKFRFKYFISLILPAAVIILSLCSYNYYSLGLFTITPFGEANLSGVTILFMEPSEEYPEIVNEAIKNTLDSIPRTQKNYIRNSWGISELYHTFNENFYRQVNFTEDLMRLDPNLTFVAIQPIMRKVSVDAIKKSPRSYGKFVMSNFIFFFNNQRITMDYYEQMANVYKRTVVDEKYIKELTSGRWRMISSDRSDNEKVAALFRDEISLQKKLSSVTVNEQGIVMIGDGIYKSVYNVFEKIYNIVFRNILWVILFFAVFLISIYKLFKSGFKDTDAFIPFLLCMTFMFKAVLVSLVEVSLERYSLTVEYVYYFSLPFLLIMLNNSKKNNPEEIIK
ncbi:MAG TPA: hypothetical protein PKA90_00030 [Ignavibacteria bacterium]|mgnify:CR=1 FL=1|nr:hypothetical protein [Ignavibacteria bacterium]HMR38791.1 hypothetical protein [Ignavibacteria bacterium]